MSNVIPTWPLWWILNDEQENFLRRIKDLYMNGTLNLHDYQTERITRILSNKSYDEMDKRVIEGIIEKYKNR